MVQKGNTSGVQLAHEAGILPLRNVPPLPFWDDNFIAFVNFLAYHALLGNEALANVGGHLIVKPLNIVVQFLLVFERQLELDFFLSLFRSVLDQQILWVVQHLPVVIFLPLYFQLGQFSAIWAVIFPV